MKLSILNYIANVNFKDSETKMILLVGLIIIYIIITKLYLQQNSLIL